MLFLMGDSEYPLSGGIEEDSIKPESNQAVQTTFRVQDYNNDRDDPKKLRKYVSLKSPNNSKEEHMLKSMTMNTAQFVLKEIMERKEQDISLDGEQNDGMKSPQVESDSHMLEDQSVQLKKSSFSKIPPGHVKGKSGFEKPKELNEFDENFDNFHLQDQKKEQPVVLSKENDISEDF